MRHVLVVFTLAAGLALPGVARAQDIGFSAVRTSAPLSRWDLGRARMYIESAATACTLGRRPPPEGDSPISFSVRASGDPARVTVRGEKRLARCLRGILRGVRFPAADAAYTWDGVLTMGIPDRLSVKILRFEAISPLHRDTLRNTLLARLEELPTCIRDALGTDLSVALNGAFQLAADGTLARPEITLSTHAPDALLTCLRDHLAPLRFPSAPTSTEVKMFFHLLQPSHDTRDDVPTITVGP